MPTATPTFAPVEKTLLLGEDDPVLLGVPDVKVEREAAAVVETVFGETVIYDSVSVGWSVLRAFVYKLTRSSARNLI